MPSVINPEIIQQGSLNYEGSHFEQMKQSMIGLKIITQEEVNDDDDDGDGVIHKTESDVADANVMELAWKQDGGTPTPTEEISKKETLTPIRDGYMETGYAD